MISTQHWHKVIWLCRGALTMSDDLDMPSSRFMEEHVQQMDECSGTKTCCVEVLSICEVKVTVEQLHVLLVVCC